LKNTFNKKTVVGVVASINCVVACLAADFNTTSTPGEVLIGFRKSGGANNLVVDAGSLASFTNLAPNTRITISTYTGTQLAQVGTNSVSWSAFAYYNSGIFCSTVARSVIGTQASPYGAQSAAAQKNVTSQMDNVQQGANYNYTLNGPPANSTATAVVESSSSASYLYGYSYTDGILGVIPDTANWGGTSLWYPENTTAANFTTAGSVARSDFYLVPPTGGGAVTYLGYFEFNTNGVMSYVAYPITYTAPSVPVIKGITRTNNVTTVSFTTGASGTYTLRGTNTLASGVNRTNWPAIASLTGNGLTNSLSHTTTNAAYVYVITAQ
jgi:hypothetical protein